MATSLLQAAGIQPWSQRQPGNSFGDAAAASSNPGTTQLSPGAAPPAPAMPRSQQLESAMTMGPPATRKDASIMQQQWRGVQSAIANERYNSAGAQMAQEARDAAAQRQNRAAIRPLYGPTTTGPSPGEQALEQFDTANPAPPPPALPGYNYHTQGEMGPPDLSRLPSSSDTAPPPSAPAPAPTPAPASTGNVTRVGNSYSGTNVSGDISINGRPAGGGLLAAAGIPGYGPAPTPAPESRGPSLIARAFPNGISAQNNQAAENLSANSQNMTIGQMARYGMLPPPNPEYSGTIGQSSGVGNMWSRSPEQQRRDAEVQASSIHRRTAALGANALRSLDNQDLENVRGANAFQQEIARIRGANYRAGLQEAGANARAGERSAIERERLAMDQTTAGYANRASGQLENLRGVLANMDSTPEQRQQASQAIMALQGRQPQAEWGVQVTPTTKNVDGSTSMGSIVKWNKATGQTEIVGQPSTPPPSDNHIAWLKQNPNQAGNFDQIYGAGAAKRALGQG